MKFTMPLVEGFMPKYPEMRMKQFTPIMENDSISIFVIVLMSQK